MSKTKIVIPIVTTMWLCLLLIVFTYTWVIRNSTPGIEQEDLKISPAGALVISLSGDESYGVVDLNEVVALDSFVFKQVSSVDAKNFMWLDFTPTLEDKPAVYRSNAPESNYVDVRFAIKLDDTLETGRYVFLHPDCSIKDNNPELDVAKAIRIALDYDVELSDGSTENHTYIFGNTTDDADTDYFTNAVKKDAAGKSEDDLTATSQQEILNFRCFNGGRTGEFNSDNPSDPENYNFELQSEKCLFKIEPGQIQWVNMRIWLEGADENCVNMLAGETFDMVLKFDSVSAPQE